MSEHSQSKLKSKYNDIIYTVTDSEVVCYIANEIAYHIIKLTQR